MSRVSLSNESWFYSAVNDIEKMNRFNFSKNLQAYVQCNEGYFILTNWQFKKRMMIWPFFLRAVYLFFKYNFRPHEDLESLATELNTLLTCHQYYSCEKNTVDVASKCITIYDDLPNYAWDDVELMLDDVYARCQYVFNFNDDDAF